jgi:hypothetical protein
MLRERRIHRYAYDAAADLVRLETDDAPGNSEEIRKAALLLDARGHLVGVDLGGTGANRTVAMLGPHEAVHRMVDAEVRVTKTAAGDPSAICIPQAKTWIRTTELNPYG